MPKVHFFFEEVEECLRRCEIGSGLRIFLAVWRPVFAEFEATIQLLLVYGDLKKFRVCPNVRRGKNFAAPHMFEMSVNTFVSNDVWQQSHQGAKLI